MATRDEVLAALRVRHEVVRLRGVDVWVWELPADRRLEVGAAAKKAGEEGRSENERGTMLAAACIGDEGGPFSPPLTAEEILGSYPLPVINALCEAAGRLNASTEEAAEELRGN